MPGYDRTGPQGMGPMTGGRRGNCSSPQYDVSGLGYGGSGGRRGRGCGFGRGYGGAQPTFGAGRFPAASDERATLKTEAENLKRGLDAIQRRLAALENPMK